MATVKGPLVVGKYPLHVNGSTIQMEILSGEAQPISAVTYVLRGPQRRKAATAANIADGRTILLGNDRELVGYRLYIFVEVKAVNGLKTAVSVQLLGGVSTSDFNGAFKAPQLGDNVAYEFSILFTAQA